MEKDIPYEWNQRAGVAILISDKINFKSKPEKKDESYYIMIVNLSGGINIYTLNIRASKHIKQILTGQKENIDSITIMGISKPLSKIDKLFIENQ